MKIKIFFPLAFILCANILSCAAMGGYRGEASTPKSLDKALAEAAKFINSKLNTNEKVAILNFNSPTAKFAEYVIYELEANLLDIGHVMVIDRSQIDLRRNELNFQMSGEVSDNSMKSIGQTLGAEIVVSGSLADLNGSYRVVLRVLSVENGTVIAQYRSDVTNDNRVRSLLGNTK